MTYTVTSRLLIILIKQYEFREGKRTAGNSASCASAGISLLPQILVISNLFSYLYSFKKSATGANAHPEIHLRKSTVSMSELRTSLKTCLTPSFWKKELG
jgi:hypothetical protein